VTSDCVFCRIVAGEVESALVCEDELACCFVDRQQLADGHVLVVPRRHVRELYELTEDEAAALGVMVLRVARAVRDAYEPEGLNIWQSNGGAAGQRVFHVHFHIHPREHADGLFSYNKTPARRGNDHLHSIAQRVQAHLAD